MNRSHIPELEPKTWFKIVSVLLILGVVAWVSKFVSQRTFQEENFDSEALSGELPKNLEQIFGQSRGYQEAQAGSDFEFEGTSGDSLSFIKQGDALKEKEKGAKLEAIEEEAQALKAKPQIENVPDSVSASLDSQKQRRTSEEKKASKPKLQKRDSSGLGFGFKGVQGKSAGSGSKSFSNSFGISQKEKSCILKCGKASQVVGVKTEAACAAKGKSWYQGYCIEQEKFQACYDSEPMCE